MGIGLPLLKSSDGQVNPLSDHLWKARPSAGCSPFNPPWAPQSSARVGTSSEGPALHPGKSALSVFTAPTPDTWPMVSPRGPGWLRKLPGLHRPGVRAPGRTFRTAGLGSRRSDPCRILTRSPQGAAESWDPTEAPVALGTLSHVFGSELWTRARLWLQDQLLQIPAASLTLGLFLVRPVTGGRAERRRRPAVFPPSLR